MDLTDIQYIVFFVIIEHLLNRLKMSDLPEKLKSLPTSAGVYIHKNYYLNKVYYDKIKAIK